MRGNGVGNRSRVGCRARVSARMGAVGTMVNGRMVVNGLGGVVGAVNGLNGAYLPLLRCLC